MIDSFKGPYRFLSNFWIATLEYEGVTYKSAENAYQAAKTSDEATKVYIASLTPGQAKDILAASSSLPIGKITN